MHRKIIFFLLCAFLLSACISVSVDSEIKDTPPPDFVTSTLPPTKSGFVPSTLTPLPAITTTSTLPTVVITAPANCTDSAVLLRDITIPDGTRVNAGEKFTKAWEFLNNGTCSWTNYTLVFAAGDQMGAPLSGLIPTTLSGDRVTISVDLIAPSTNGEFTAYFTLKNSSGRQLPIGAEKTFWVKIIVGGGSPQATTPATINISTPYVPVGGNNNCAYTANGGYVQQLTQLINQARADVNLPRLAVNDQLRAAAQAHSADMACNNFLDHIGSDSSWISDRLVKAGYSFSYFGEIIAIGAPQNAMDQWASDAPHWESVLDPSATEIGVGYAYYASSDFGGYITVDFGRP